MDGGGGGDGGGIDHGHDHGDHGDHGHHGHDMGGHPDQSPIWSQAMQGLKLNDFISSIRITPNHLLLFMFAGFTGWLGVIYWIRHHEPMANHMLGSGPAYTSHSQADRLLINGAREALPIKTVAGSGVVYTPGSTPNPVAPMQTYSSGVRFSSPRQNLAIQSSAMNAPASSTNVQGAPNYAAPAMMPVSGGIGHSARLFSHRDQVSAGGLNQAMPGRAPGRMVGYELGAPSGGLNAASPQQQGAQLVNQPVIQPVIQPGWSLAKDGFSQNPAQFDSRFGSPTENQK
ncbi:hypothetical protein BH11CYA1_BH11CYA1_21770 [soil metagenome]